MSEDSVRKTLAMSLKRFHPSPSEQKLMDSGLVDCLRADNEKRILEAQVSFPSIVSKDELYQLESHIAKEYELRAVRLLPHYDASLFSAAYMPEVLKEACRIGVIASGFFDTYQYDVTDHSIVIHLPIREGGLTLLSNARTNEVIEKILAAEFSDSYHVSFVQSEDFERVEEEWARQREAEEQSLRQGYIASRAAAAARQAEPAPEKPAEEKKELPRVVSLRAEDTGPAALIEDTVKIGCLTFDVSAPELFFGLDFSLSNVSRIRDLSKNKGAVILGKVFKSDLNENRAGDRHTLKIGIYDGDTSIFAVVSGSPEEVAPMSESVFPGMVVALSGFARFDKFENDLIFRPNAAAKIKCKKRKDNAEEKRVELHLHTNMSTMDALIPPKTVVDIAHEWGHPAIAITDHGNVQAYPEAMEEAEAVGQKVIYGMEAYFVDDTARAVYGSCENKLTDPCVVFDIETTGLSPIHCRITEIGAVRLENGQVTASFDTFVDPEGPIPEEITQLTGITDEMVKDAPGIAEALDRFMEFCGDSLLIAHNANFDMSFLRNSAIRVGKRIENPYLDTVALSRYVNPDLKKHKLDDVANYFGLGDFNHHRAADDAEMLALIYVRMVEKLVEEGVTSIPEMMRAMQENADPLTLPTYHMVLLVKNKIGLKNLYKLISSSYLDYFRKVPRIPKTMLDMHREGILVGSACEAGQLFRAVVDNRSDADLREIASYYDYLEIQPICNNRFLIETGRAADDEQLRNFNRKIVEIGEATGRPVVATCDAHFLEKEDEISRKILLVGMKFKDGNRDVGLYLRTTDEMLEEFSYLGEEKAREVVITNTNAIAALIDPDHDDPDLCVRPIPKGTYTPHMDGAEEQLQEACYETAKSIYGDPLPEIVSARLKKELDSIITHGFAVLYMIARKLVKYSESEGYLVGSRGSVGSSFVAFVGGISEVNPLPPHYVCRKCKYSDFSNEGGYGSGFDMPDRKCPVCGELLYSDGHDIPFETFLGFKGDKSPDIDLNFSGEVQPLVHRYTATLFGKENCFRAGTLGTLADKTAFGFVNKYLEGLGISVSRAEVERLVLSCVGVKRTTGQHPGGIVVIPKEYEIYDFCPVQHPADDPTSDTVTTHFAFATMHDTILKLDELGHDVPTKYKQIERFTHTSVMDVKMNDPDVYKLFTGTEILGIDSSELIDSKTGTLGIPELGTAFVKPVLTASNPRGFADLLQVSGLTHGTGVWNGNAKDLIDQGICDLAHVIGTRDGIMLDLIRFGLENGMSFKIMEFVRKNKKGKPIPDEMIAAMKEKNVPDWYIDSLQKIRYMFPKAHAAAYVMSAIRIAWYKVHMPLEFYAAFFTAAPGGFDAELVGRGRRAVRARLEEIKAKGMDTSQKENAEYATFQLVEEAMARGIKFLPVSYFKSGAFDFLPEDGAIRMPFSALNGVGQSAAQAIVNVREEDDNVLSIEELQQRAQLTKGVVEILSMNGAFQGLSETAQISLF